MNSIKDFTTVQCARRLLSGTRHVGSPAPPKHDAACLGYKQKENEAQYSHKLSSAR